MTDKDDEFLKKLLETFAVEAQEHLQGMYAGLLRMEKGEGAANGGLELVETVFREAHSLKGAARAVNLLEVESLCQALEGVFAALKKNLLTISTGLFDLLQETLDFLALVLADVCGERTREEKILQRQLISRLEGVEKGGVVPEMTVLPEEVCPLSPAAEFEIYEPPLPLSADPALQKATPPLAAFDTVRVPTARLTSVLLQSEEMLSAKLAASQHLTDMRSANAEFGAWKKEWVRVRPLVQKIKNVEMGEGGRGVAENQRSLARVLDFLDWNSAFIQSFEARLKIEVKSVERDGRELGCMVNNLLGEMKKVLMFPFSSLLESLPKTVRDLSRENGKKIELLISGEEIEIDRRILEEMKDPLLHLVRNCIDHGIETPAERTAKGKPQSGNIRVAIRPMDDKVELTIDDDGGGIPLDAVRSALHKFGTLSRERVAELGDKELLAQVFQSGVTTSPIITEISGRGLGLAIVREKVEKLGGTVSIETAPDAGTRFRIVLPLTVATFRGVLVRLGECFFVLPAMYVARVLRVKAEEVKSVENRSTISFDGEPVSLASLAAVLELSERQTDRDSHALLPTVLLAASGTRIAFQVDEVMGELEVLHKGLGRQLSRVRNVAGATLLGNGLIAPVLNVADLLKSAVKMAAYSSPRSGAAATVESAGHVCSVLVVEDSITTRTLLKNILESAGYEVTTAVDGVDAFTKLKCGTFDIVVSDVDMPRMNGFDLTAKIRADKALEELPVILVTSLSTREDRERGIDAGANAYIVKNSFDQSDLLEVMKKLI